jgi:lysophospholipase L1-like esterase
MLGFGKYGVGLPFLFLSQTYGAGKCATGENSASIALHKSTMTKLKRNLLIVSLTLNAVFLFASLWVLQEKGGISYLQLKFRERQSGPFVEKTYAPRKREAFREMTTMLPKGGIILLGDSLTEVGPWAELLPGKQIRNRGISGDTTGSLFHRLEEISDAQPEQIFLLIGINDLKGRVPPDEIAANYARILDQLQTGCPNATIYTQSLLPTHNDLFAANYEEVEQLNEMIAELAQKRTLQHLDLYPHFTIHGNQPNPAYFTDGLHLTAKGYLRWASLLTPHIQATP